MKNFSYHFSLTKCLNFCLLHKWWVNRSDIKFCILSCSITYGIHSGSCDIPNPTATLHKCVVTDLLNALIWCLEEEMSQEPENNIRSALCFNKWDHDAILWIHIVFQGGMGLYHLSMGRWYWRNYPCVCNWYFGHIKNHPPGKSLSLHPSRSIFSKMLKQEDRILSLLILTDRISQTWEWKFWSHSLSSFTACPFSPNTRQRKGGLD